MPLHDEITQAVLARDEVARYLQGTTAETGLQARERIHAYLDELRTTQRYAIYRALKHPLYPDPAQGRAHQRRRAARRAGRHGELARGLRLEPQEPPRLSGRAAGARGQPGPAAGDRRRHQPVRRSARHHPPARDRRHSDPAEHEGPGVSRDAQGLRRRGAAPPRSVLLHRGRPQLHRRVQGAEDRTGARGAAGGRSNARDHPGRRRLRPRPRGPHPVAPGREAAAAARSAASSPRWSAPRSAITRARSSASASRFRRPGSITIRAATCSSWRTRPRADRRAAQSAADGARRRRPCARRALAATSSGRVGASSSNGSRARRAPTSTSPIRRRSTERGVGTARRARRDRASSGDRLASATGRCCATTRARSSTCSTPPASQRVARALIARFPAMIERTVQGALPPARGERRR